MRSNRGCVWWKYPIPLAPVSLWLMFTRSCTSLLLHVSPLTVSNLRMGTMSFIHGCPQDYHSVSYLVGQYFLDNWKNSEQAINSNYLESFLPSLNLHFLESWIVWHEDSQRGSNTIQDLPHTHSSFHFCSHSHPGGTVLSLTPCYSVFTFTGWRVFIHLTHLVWSISIRIFLTT